MTLLGMFGLAVLFVLANAAVITWCVSAAQGDRDDKERAR